MATESTLVQALVSRLSNYRKSAPVFNLVQRPLDLLEKEALVFGHRLAAAAGAAGTRASLRRGREATTITLQQGVAVKLFHASGALLAHTAIAPGAHLFREMPAKEALASRATDVVRRLGLEELPGPNERLEFERLWQIKAAGAQPNGKRGYEVLCRAVGAFRRFVYDLPVLGRASVFVKLAADDVIEAAGCDWRTCEERAFDDAALIDPAQGASQIVKELALAAGDTHLSAERYDTDFFGLGYLSFAKRRAQSVLQPVYVAMLRPRGWTTLGRVVVVPATERVYEPIGRRLVAPPRPAAAKRQAR